MRNIGFPLPDFEKMKMWMWSEQQRSLTSSSPLRLPLLQFLIQSAQVISFSFSSYSISNHISPNFIFNFVVNAMQCKQKRNWKSHPLWNTPHCLSSLIDSTPPSPGPNSNSNFFTYIHISGIWFNFFFLSQITLTMNLQFSWTEASIVSQHYLYICSFFSQITLHINLHLWFNYSIFMNWNVNCITTYTIIDLCMLSFFHFFF